MAERHAGKALKRRGILAAAGAVVAGIVAKQAAQPVAAAYNLQGDAGNTAHGNTQIITASTYPANTPVLQVVQNTAGYIFNIFGHQAAIRGESTVAEGVVGATAANGTAGVYGTSLVGVQDAIGVYGNTLYTGVFGRGGGLDSSVGVKGVSTAGVSVLGQCDTPSGTGVKGSSMNGMGVLGQIAPGSTANNTIAIYGVNYSSGANNVGVYGAANTGSGVVGVTYGTGVLAGVYGTSTSAYGVIGSTTAAGYSGLTAITGTAGAAALAATSTNANAYAAYFTGTTVVQGDFVAFGGGKSAAVKDAAGQHRLVYCVESPEAWFEDFGEGALVSGRATVALDKTFAEIVHTDRYHVYVTPHDAGNKGLAATVRTATGFTVQELHGGASSGTFSYRVVAKRKDIAGERLAKFTLPKIKTPDPDKLLKPEPPKKP